MKTFSASSFRLSVGLLAALPVVASAQIPDLLNSLDPGSPSLGSAGAFDVTNANTFSTYYNPAGLGYITARQFGGSYRNLPTSRTRISGSFADPTLDSDAQAGSNGVTHLGFAYPLRGGTLGLSYTTGGFIEDTATGNGLTAGNLSLNNYSQRTEARADFFTLAFGRTNPTGLVSFGFGLVLARQLVESRVSGVLSDGQGNDIPFPGSDDSETGTGVGAIIGVQITPKNMPNTQIGVSVRTPISLSGNSDTSDLYDRIPGVLRIGYATRVEGVRRGREDYLVYGAHLATYFGGDGSGAFDRDTQTTLGIGAEYNLARGAGFFPLRIGYLAIPRGGDGFDRRDSITLGIGYRPTDLRYSLDLSYILPRSGGNRDLAFAVSYRFR